MIKSILQRLEALEAHRAGMSGPVDGLSKSLWEHGAYLASLDDAALMTEGAELGISLEDMRQMVADFARRS